MGMRPTSFDPEFEIMKDLLSGKHVDDINLGGTEPRVDHYTAEVEKPFGKSKLTKRQFTNCGVQYTLMPNHDMQLDQDAYISTLRPIVSTDLTGARPEDRASPTVCAQFVSLRGALAYTTLTQDWIKVYIVALQRVPHLESTNLDVRPLNAVTPNFQKDQQMSFIEWVRSLDLSLIHI